MNLPILAVSGYALPRRLFIPLVENADTSTVGDQTFPEYPRLDRDGPQPDGIDRWEPVLAEAHRRAVACWEAVAHGPTDQQEVAAERLRAFEHEARSDTEWAAGYRAGVADADRLERLGHGSPEWVASHARLDGYYRGLNDAQGDARDPVRRYLVNRQVGPHVIKWGLPYLLDEWERTTERVEGDVHTWMLDEWLNDLDGREILHGVLENVAVSDDVRARLEPVDARFAAASIEVDECVWGRKAEQRHGWTNRVNWWYWRTPTTPYETFD